MNKGTRRKEAEAVKSILSGTPSHAGSSRQIHYDRVLVDADCTHDGSVRHMGKVAAMEDER